MIKDIELLFSDQDESVRELSLLLALLPPPISLDLLCTVTDRTPVKTLQTIEALHNRGYLSKDPEKGTGFYYLPDFARVRKSLEKIPQSILFHSAQMAVEGVCRDNSLSPDDQRKFVSMALAYSEHFCDPVLSITLRVLVAKSYIISSGPEMARGLFLHSERETTRKLMNIWTRPGKMGKPWARSTTGDRTTLKSCLDLNPWEWFTLNGSSILMSTG